MNMEENNSVALLKTIIKKYVESIYNILYYNKSISTATYEKLALSIDSLKMLMISMEWYNKRNSTVRTISPCKEFDENIMNITLQLKRMITEFNEGKIDDEKFIKLKEYLDTITKSVQINNNRYIKEMVKTYMK